MSFPQRFKQAFILATLCTSLSPLGASPQLEELKAGNQRFVNNKPQKCLLNYERKPVPLESQHPIAAILACSDSRVPPEILFDQNSGDLFVIRLAGNTVDELALGSIEYAVTYLKTPLLVILGHENCGAVQATFALGDTSFSPNIEALLHQIYPAIQATREKHPGMDDKKLLDYAIRENVHHTQKEILARSPTVTKALNNKTFEIVEGLFSIQTGQVEWLPTSNEKQILNEENK